MSFKCKKCKKYFSNSYNYEKHINRKNPCDEILQCNKCKKVFTIFQHLESHMKRKTPCVVEKIEEPVVEEETKSLQKQKIEIEKLKIEVRLKELETKFLLQEKIEKSRENTAKSRKELIKLKKKTNINSNNNSNNVNSNNNVSYAQNKINIITNNVVNYITENYKYNKTIEDLPKRYEFISKELKGHLYPKSREMVKDIYENPDGFEKTLLTYCHPSKSAQCLFYIEELEKFFGIYKNGSCDIKVKEVKVRKEILPNLNEFLLSSLKYVYNNIHRYKIIEERETRYTELSLHIESFINGYYDTQQLLQNIFVLSRKIYEILD